MSTQRHSPAPYAAIPNATLRDTRLSFKARGLLAMMLSHSGEWEAPLRWLEGQSEHDGRHAIQQALNELTALGYRTVSRERTDAGIRTVVVWHDTPIEQISRPTGNLTVRKPDRQETRGSTEDHLSEHHQSEHHLFSNPAAAVLSDGHPLPAVAVVGFDTFWTVYPRKVGKDAARRAWAKAVRQVPAAVIVAGAERVAADPNLPDAQFIPHPATWLNRGGWEDDPYPPRSTGQPTRAQQRVTETRSLLERAAARDAQREQRGIGA